MATNKTTNYQLNQWEKTDRILMDDFNADNAKIDAAMLGKKLLLDYTTEEEALTVEVPLTGVDWGSCAVAVIKIIPSETQERPDDLWVYFNHYTNTYNGGCRQIVDGSKLNYFSPANLNGASMIFLFVGHNPNHDITCLTFHGSDVYACSFNSSLSDRTTLKIFNRNSGKTAAGTRVQIWGLA